MTPFELAERLTVDEFAMWGEWFDMEAKAQKEAEQKARHRK